MSAIEKIKEVIAEAVMRRNGWTEESKTTNPLDWDPNSEDSQYAMVVEDINYIIDSFLEELSGFEIDEDEEEEEDDDDDFIEHGHSHDHGHGHGHDHTHEHENIFDEYGHIKRTQTNTTSAVVFIFMDAGTGKPRYVSDVKEWLARVERLGIPDNTEIEGTLHLSVDINEPYIERIECGGCGSKDVLLTVHSCEETPC
jgi:hypothetical protein